VRRPFSAARTAQRGGFRKDGAPARPGTQMRGRLAVSDSLARSALVTGQGSFMPLREAGIVVALVNHPFLLEQHFEEVERVGLTSPELKRLLSVIVDAVAHDLAHDREALQAAIGRAGLEATWERAETLTKRARLWPLLAGADPSDAADAFKQALHLQRATHFLNRELRAAETALASEPTEENYRHLVEIQSQLQSVQATEALIEGFGIGSGRAAGG
jgi:DNA primase